MAAFLIRKRDDLIRGYVEYRPESGDLPRTKQESYVPWGLTTAREVVYARTGEHGSWNGGKGQYRLTPYDTLVSQDRRKLCQSELGDYALSVRKFTHGAVNKVTAGVKRYLAGLLFTDSIKAKETVHKEIGHYFYTGGRKGFGRIDDTRSSKNMSADQVWLGIIETLEGGRIDQLLAIHDAIGRKILPKLGGAPTTVYDKWKPVLRQDWFDDPNKRGRVKAPTRVKATLTGGIIQSSKNEIINQVAIERDRGVDMFQRDMNRLRDDRSDAYYDNVDSRNLLFGAGISGTTGTLLQSAFAFGKLSTGEELKQYVMAIVGYLVGGGMHSYHEVMAVARKAGVEYIDGGFEQSLPESFKQSPEYTQWRQEYYDVAVLGRLHWMYNKTCLPSHLNKNLRT